MLEFDTKDEIIDKQALKSKKALHKSMKIVGTSDTLFSACICDVVCGTCCFINPYTERLLEETLYCLMFHKANTKQRRKESVRISSIKRFTRVGKFDCKIEKLIQYYNNIHEHKKPIQNLLISITKKGLSLETYRKVITSYIQYHNFTMNKYTHTIKKILHTQQKNLYKKWRKFRKNNKTFKRFATSKEFQVITIFGVLLGMILLRLFYLQVIRANHYEKEISKIHYKESTLQAQRGQIYVMDKTDKPIQLTENISVYDLYIEPQHLANDENKEKLIQILTPFLYEHLCVSYAISRPTPEQCVKNIESFTSKDLLPEMPEFFYLGSGIMSTGYSEYNFTGYYDQIAKTLSGMTQPIAEKLIADKLREKIKIGVREYNYLGFYENPSLLQTLDTIPGVKVYNNYVYIQPSDITNASKTIKTITTLLNQYGFHDMESHITSQMEQKENTYIKIASELHPKIASKILQLKKEYKQGYQQCYGHYIKELNTNHKSCTEYLGERDSLEDRKSLMHGVGLDQYSLRHYPFDTFLSHVLGYVNKNNVPTYGIEEYMDKTLRGKDGKIIGRSSAMIGDIGANEFDIEKAINGQDIYLTIDPTIQKEVSTIAHEAIDRFRADSVSITVLNPFNGHVAALVNAPEFNPNEFNDAFSYIPLSAEYKYLVDGLSYIDIHLYVRDEETGNMRKATTTERSNPTIPKYMTKNVYSSEIFVDKNIKYAYEPGSVIKALTMAIGIDTDEINLFDFYKDKGFVKVGPYTIKNVADQCLGENSYLNALIYSCNVGMVRIVQAVGKQIFYNYLNKLGFGKKTGIELAGEEEGFVGYATTVSLARFLNNSFGLGMRATPLQMASSYATLVNGGYLIKPTIIAKQVDTTTGEEFINDIQIVRRVFKEDTTIALQDALFDVIHQNSQNKANTAIEGFSLAGKSGTSEIPYKGRYIGSAGWTNASFIGIITKDSPHYVIIVQVRRPRINKRGTETAGKIFRDVAEFIIGYDLIPE